MASNDICGYVKFSTCASKVKNSAYTGDCLTNDRLFVSL